MPRRKTLDGDRFISFRATRQDQKHLQVLLQTSARHGLDVGKTQCIRDALGLAARTANKAEFDELQRLRTQLEASKQDLEQERKERQKAERRAESMAKKRTKAGTHLSNLARHIPDVKRRVDLGLEFECGIRVLDQLWLNNGRSWARVAKLLEEA